MHSLCLPANFSRNLVLTTFLELSDAYTLCSDAEDTSPACVATRSAYYAALGCHFCGITEQALLVGFRACLPFDVPEECATANPRGLEALPESSAVSRARVWTDDVAGRDLRPEPKRVRILQPDVVGAIMYRVRTVGATVLYFRTSAATATGAGAHAGFGPLAAAAPYVVTHAHQLPWNAYAACRGANRVCAN